MIRTLALTALVSVGFALPAVAETSAPVDPATAGAFSTELDDAATGEQARLMLMHGGYTNVSVLDHYAPGRWTGTAVKNGKPVTVSVVWPHVPQKTPAID